MKLDEIETHNELAADPSHLAAFLAFLWSNEPLELPVFMMDADPDPSGEANRQLFSLN